MNRRAFIGHAAALAATMALPIRAAGADRDKFWHRVAADFDRPDGVINLEHGYWTKLARPVEDRYFEHQAFVNRYSSIYARQYWGEDHALVLERLAAQLGCRPAELALTRNASEALQALIGGYRNLSSADAVLYADLDYPSVQAAFDSLARDRGAELIKIALPEPATFDNVIGAYEAALDANPHVRLLVLTHVSNRTGLVVPVREIIERARVRDVDVIVDAAHSWGQLDVAVVDLGADFIAFNLHKWIGAPLGVGLLYIREGRLDAIAPNQSASIANAEKTSGRVYTGTMNFAAVRTVIDALDYCDQVGWANKERRFRLLRDTWVRDVRDLPGVEVLTPDDPRLYTGLTSFRLKGRTSDTDNKALASRLFNEFGIFTVFRGGVAGGACIRVTPGLENTPMDCEKLAAAIRTIVA